MMNNIKSFYTALRITTGVMLMFCMIETRAQQEPMFTQYIFNETFINPAYTGSREGLSVNMLYRNQWSGINGSPRTQTITAHLPVSKRRVGIGFSAMNESIGVSKKIMINGDFAYRIIMPQSVLSFGLKGGFVNDQENFTDVNTTTSGDQQFASDVRKYFLPNAGFGVYYYYQKKFYAGFSIPRLIHNKVDPSNSGGVIRNMGNPQIWHYYFTGGYVFDLDENTKLKPSVLVKCVQHAPIELDASLNLLLADLIWIGGSYRTGDAVACLVGFQLSKNFRIGYSYDYSLTDLRNTIQDHMSLR